ncbi:MAG: DUF3696 domain-containing protein [Promethearchaeota archaeon]
MLRRRISPIELRNFQYSIKNFKSITTNKFISLKPITIFCGVNSIGKSSILQSKLLLSQSLANRMSRLEDNGEYPQIFVFEGDKCHLQNFKNIIFENNIKNNLLFRWNYRFGMMDVKIRINCSYFNRQTGNSNEIPIVENIQILNIKKNLKRGIELNLSDKNNYFYNLTFKNFFENNIFLERELNQNIPYWLIQEEIEKSDNFSPEIYFELSNKIVEDLKLDLKEIYEINKIKVGFWSIFPQYIEIKSNVKDFFNFEKLKKKFIMKFEGEKKSRRIEKFIIRIIERVTERYLRQIIRPLIGYYLNIRYLGPLREEPKRYYLFSDLNLLDLGHKGENTMQVLLLMRNKKVDFIRLEENINGEIRFSQIEKKTLLEGLNNWLEIMNLQKIKPEQTMDLVSKLLIKYSEKQPKDSPVAIPDVGFGLSQILPVLVECLRMDPKETIILEQPEIHLHPRMQGDLADFILCNAHLGKNFIIETHSEHFIKRLCLRIAQFKNIDLTKLISIYFIVPNINNRGADIVEIEIDEFGSIKNWPIGFFDDNEDQLIIEEGFKKRNYLRNGAN